MTENPTRGRLRPLLSGVLLRAQTDERLAALASTGNQQAFSAIYERYRRELGSHARRIVRPDRADDVVQHAMLAAWNALLAGAEISDLRAWLHRVTRNAALDTINRRGYDDRDIPDSSIAPSRTDELAEGRLSATAALTAVAALPEGQRRALTLTAIEGRSGHDAALEMGISESAMRQLAYRARSAVRAAVTAVTPLPFVDWLVEAGGVSATPAVGLAGGAAATVAKVVAVIGVTAATLGATHALQQHHHARHAPNAPTSPTAATPADRGRQVGALGVQQGLADTQFSAGQHPNGGQNGSSQQGSGGNAGQQSGSQNAAGGPGGNQGNGGAIGSSQQGSGGNAGQQSGSQTAARGTGGQQSGAQQQSAATGPRVTAPSGPNNGSQPQQSSGTSGTSLGQSVSDRSSAPQNGQSSNGN